MIEPQRAPVRPRVVCPSSGEELPLEELVRSFLEASQQRTIHLHGDADSVAIRAALRGDPEETVLSRVAFPQPAAVVA
jgi:hypothetical protein